MSNLSGYDSEAVGFDSISTNKKLETTTSTQTTEFYESGVGSQTHLSKDCGSSATPEELNAQEDVLREYPPPGLNEFLRRVVPAMMDQLDQNEGENTYNSSDSDEEDVILAKLFQEIKISDVSSIGGGDQATCVLAVSWSSAGNSLAVSVGLKQHEDWCSHDGLIRIYTIKRTAGDKLVHTMDINEKNCVSVVKYHPSVAAILAYGTTSGEVVMCNLRNSGSLEEMQLTSPSGCHGSKRVTSLLWADAPLANTFLTMQINNTGKRRGASDQILISSGSDGTINVWRVNSNFRIFENVISYSINGSHKMAAPDISCFDFIKAYPLRPCDEKIPDDIFVVGSSTGDLFLCKIKTPHALDSLVLDPVVEMLEGHLTCVLDLTFTYQKPEIFVSMSIDSQIRVYDINQACPLKICHVDHSISSVSCLPNNPRVLVLGTTGGVVLYSVCGGRNLPVGGLEGGEITAVSVSQTGSCMVAAGDSDGLVRIWELPSRRIKFTTEDLDF